MDNIKLARELVKLAKNIYSQSNKKASILISVSAATDWDFGHVYGTIHDRLSNFSYDGFVKELNKTARAMVKRFSELKRNHPDVKQTRPIEIVSSGRSEFTLSLEFEKNEGTVIEES